MSSITDIRLQNFRSYADSAFELAPGVNIIVGPNASGKTNLLESVLVLARGGSYRAKDAELVSFDAPWSRLDAHISDEASGTTTLRTVKIECQQLPGGASAADIAKLSCKKSYVIDDQIVLRLTAPKMLPLVIFEPNHLLLLSGSPELRRSYLDDLIEQTVPGFGSTRRHYKRVLAQRNALLKKNSPKKSGYTSSYGDNFNQAGHMAREMPSRMADEMFVWNLRLSELAGKIVQERMALLARINQIAGDVYTQISRIATDVTVNYVSPLPVEQYESAMLKKLEHSLERDYMLGFTTTGPHREDIQVLLGNHILQDTASRGETRTIILALKIIELQLIEAARPTPPILLLDDVFSELDGSRRQALTVFLRKYQTLITTTDADVVVQHFMDDCAIIPMER